jgi:hypothetical protein
MIERKTDGLVLCCTTLIVLAFNVLSSFRWATELLATFAMDWFLLVLWVPLLVLFFFALWVVQTPVRAAYWVGASVMLGVMPTIPHLVFLTEFEHVALFLFVAANWRNYSIKHFWQALSDAKLTTYSLFMLIAISSVAINFALVGDIWQLKVGLGQLILYFIFFIASAQVIILKEPKIFHQLLFGFLDSLCIITVLGVLVTVMILTLPYSQGPDGDGRYTLFGLGYFDRLKLFFDGPGVSGCYFVIGMAIAFYVLSIRDGVLRFTNRRALLLAIQVIPWLVIASGSRTAKLAMVAIIVIGLCTKFTRMVAVTSLPSSLLALLIGLDSQSLLMAVRFWTNYFLPDFQFFDSEHAPHGVTVGVLEGRFFEFGERAVLLMETVAALSSMPWVQNILGMGLGVAGYSASPYPSPHNLILDMVVEVGLLGAMSYFVFWGMCWLGCRGLPGNSDQLNQFRRSLFAGMIALAGLFTGYDASQRGITLFFLLLLISYVHELKRSASGQIA